MKYLFLLTLILGTLNGKSQEVQVKQLKYLLLEMKNNFQKTIDKQTLSDDYFLNYNSNINLEGTIDNGVTISKDSNYSNSYVAYISDSCSKKDAEKLASFWKDIIQTAAPYYNETKLSGKDKDIQGNPRHGFKYNFDDSEYSYGISITYIKRYSGKGYLVMLCLGRQKKLI